jgi:F-type H+-transporting ATPase subunit b
MTWLIYKPTNKYLERRREYISNEILNAEEKNKMISDEIEKLMEEKRLVKMESSKIIDDAKNLGNEEKSKLINEGKKQAMIVFENAKKHVESVKEKNIKKNNEEIVLLATKISQGILKKKFTKKENNKLFSEIEQKMKDIKPIS